MYIHAYTCNIGLLYDLLVWCIKVYFIDSLPARVDRYKNCHSSDEDSEGESCASSKNDPFIKFDSSSRRMSILLSDWSLNSSCESEENKRKTSEASSITAPNEEERYV